MNKPLPLDWRETEANSGAPQEGTGGCFSATETEKRGTYSDGTCE